MNNNIILYGIPNCNSVKKAREWLKDHNVDYQFFNFKKQAVDNGLITFFLEQISYEHLINKKGLTYRKLDNQTKINISLDNVENLILENTSIMKRPILNVNNKLYLSFDTNEYSKIFNIKNGVVINE